MEKISRILPTDKRITTVDMRSSGVSRPGSPSFGREVGMSPSRHHPEFNTSKRAIQRFEEEARMRQINAKAAMVERMADKFFVREGRDENAQPIASAAALESGHEFNVNRQLRNEVERGNVAEIMAPGLQQSRTDIPVQGGQPASQSSSQSQGQTQENGDQLVSGQHLDVRV